MLAKTSPVIAKAARRLTELSADETVRLEYERREKARRDEHSRTLFQVEKAEKKGIEKGIEIGRKEGIFEVAKNALRNNLPPTAVAKIAGLSLKEVNALAAEMAAK